MAVPVREAIKSQSVLRKKEVLERIGCSNTFLYEQIKKGFFPAPIKLSESIGRPIVGFLKEDVDRWIEQRIRASRPAASQPSEPSQSDSQPADLSSLITDRDRVVIAIPSNARANHDRPDLELDPAHQERSE